MRREEEADDDATADLRADRDTNEGTIFAIVVAVAMRTVEVMVVKNPVTILSSVRLAMLNNRIFIS